MKIAIMTDTPTVKSGYAVMARGVGKYLLRMGVEIVYIGFQHVGEPCYIYMEGKYVKIYQPTLERVLGIEKPNILIHIRDPFVYTPKYYPHPYSIIDAARRHKCKAVNWVPVNSTDYPRDVVNSLIRESDYILVFTEWGRNELLMCGVPYNIMDVLHPGVDMEIFRPQPPSRSEFNAREDRKLIGFIGVDQARKATPLILYVVSKVIEDIDCDLFLLAPLEGVFDLKHHIEVSNMKGRVLTPSIYDATWGWSSEKMARWYNTLDLYLTLSTCEGFNLPILEAASCRTPVVASNHPVHVEILGELGVYVKTSKTLPTTYSLDYIATDLDEAASKVAETLRRGRLTDTSKLEKYSLKNTAEKLLKMCDSI